MLEEAVAALDIKPQGTYVDGTFGRGGHAQLHRHRHLGELLGDGGAREELERQHAATSLGDRFLFGGFCTDLAARAGDLGAREIHLQTWGDSPEEMVHIGSQLALLEGVGLNVAVKVPATEMGLAVARQAGVAPYYNTAMVGAYGSFSGHVGLDSILEAVHEMTPASPKHNAEAARLAFDQVQIIEPGGAHD